jgi:hypothetical protein
LLHLRRPRCCGLHRNSPTIDFCAAGDCGLQETVEIHLGFPGGWFVVSVRAWLLLVLVLLLFDDLLNDEFYAGFGDEFGGVCFRGVFYRRCLFPLHTELLMLKQRLMKERPPTRITLLQHRPLIHLKHILIKLLNPLARPVRLRPTHPPQILLLNLRQILPVINILPRLLIPIPNFALRLVDGEARQAELSAADVANQSFRFSGLFGLLDGWGGVAAVWLGFGVAAFEVFYEAGG